MAIINGSAKEAPAAVSSMEKSNGDAYDPNMEDEFDEPGAIPARYRGTATDHKDMSMMGKKQVLRRNFRFVAMLGFASTVMASWELLLPFFSFVLTDGGTALLFWGLLATTIGMSLVYASVSEAASMAPTAAGAYHWVSEFAPPRMQKPLSYIVGWLSAVGWQVYLAGVCFIVGTTIQGLIALNYPSYVWHAWHGTLMSIATILFAIIFNTVLAVHLPLIEGIVLILHFAGFFAIIIPLWVMAPRAPAHTVLLEFTNYGGWSSDGLSAMIGLTTPLSILIGYDCSVHMSEEIRDASITLPKAIMWSVAVNATLAFIMAVTLIFTMGDVDSLFASVTRQPFIQVFYNTTQSYAATNAMTAIAILLITACCISEVATASRQFWSFARDGGLPGSAWLAQVSPGWHIPLRAVWISVVVVALLSCINLGSSAALNAINSLGGVAILSSYYITICCLIYRRLCGPPLPSRRWSLGKFGLPINIAALMFLTPVWFFSFWPLAQPVTAVTMNWSSTMFGGTIIFALIYYVFWARHVYHGPVTLVKRVD